MQLDNCIFIKHLDYYYFLRPFAIFLFPWLYQVYNAQFPTRLVNHDYANSNVSLFILQVYKSQFYNVPISKVSKTMRTPILK